MSYPEKISSFHLDILKEIGNIGAGNAATSLSTLLNKKIDMKVPNVKVVSFDEMMNLVGGAENIVAAVFLTIEGEIKGNMFFILPIQQATIFIREMLGDSAFTFDHIPHDELAVSALEELGNILSGAYLSALSDFTGLSVYPSVPSLCIDMFGAIMSVGLIAVSQVSDYAIVIDTALDKESEQQETVNGHFFLLPDPDSFNTLFESLGVREA